MKERKETKGSEGGDVTTGEKDERNICQVVREFAFSQFRPMECPRLPVRRVELLDEVKREKSKRESYLAVRAFKIAQEGFQQEDREERKPRSPGSPGHGQFASFNRTRLLDDGQAVSHRCLLPF